MDATLLVARLLLTGVFAMAALAKLVDRAGSRRALIDFGVPAALAPPLAVLLPLAEFAIAAALVSVASAWWGALGALTLLFLFTAVIGVHLARGRNPNCGCFGRLFSAPTGPGSRPQWDAGHRRRLSRLAGAARSRPERGELAGWPIAH